MKSTLLCCLFFLMLLGGCSRDSSNQQIKISESAADGLTQASFDEAYLQALSEEIRQAAEQRLQETYDRNRIPQQERFSHAQTEGRYELLGDRKLAVIELSYSANPMRVTRIVGILGDRKVTLSCISPLGEPVDIFSDQTRCAEGVKKAFLTEQ